MNTVAKAIPKEAQAPFGAVLQKYRSKNNISQAELAEKLNTSRNTVNNWENGRSKPDFETIKLLAQMFGIPLYELFGIEDDFLLVYGRGLLSDYRQLSASNQRIVSRIISSMLEEENNTCPHILQST